MPMFEIICGCKDTPKNTWASWQRGLTDPQEANNTVKALNIQALGDWAYMLRRMPQECDYHSREAAREGYTPFEVQGEEFHCAELKGEFISFYPDINRAFDDRRDDIKLGRYLRRYTSMTDNEIAEICAKNGIKCGDMSLQWARTRDEIRHVYENGPNSCMAGSCGPIHPTEVYATPDMAVAYILRDERITGRAVCRTDEKKFVTIYGDEVRMRALLTEQGYSRDYNCMDGAKLLKITDEYGNYFAPYIDGGYTAIRSANEGEDADFLYLNNLRGATPSEGGKVIIEDTLADKVVYSDPDGDLYFDDDYNDDYDEDYDY